MKDFTEQPTNYKFHSTQQFRNVVKSITTQTQFKGVDSEGAAVFDKTVIAPTLTYIGTTKLHGTNASIVIHESGDISFHSKSQLLGFVRGDEFTLNSDNAEFAQSMYRRMDSVRVVATKALEISKEVYGIVKYPIKISGEWCGSGIQKGVGISYLPKKSLFIFGIKVGKTDQESKSGWLPVNYTEALSSSTTQGDGIYSIMDFPTVTLDVDFNNAVLSQNELVAHTERVEGVCPVSDKLQLKDSEGTPVALGEGLVWTPVSADYVWDSGNWFKTKGQKHSVSKTKSVASVDPEKLNSIVEFVDYACTENRLEQGLGEVGLDQKKIGAFIGWVNKDINKEEGDVLEKSNLTMKDVGKMLSTKSRTFYLTKLNNDL